MSDEDDMSQELTEITMPDGERKYMKGVKWTKQEDSLLKSMVEQYGEKWDLISKQIPDRSDVQCQQRWTKVVNPDLIKGPWTKEEDDKVVELSKDASVSNVVNAGTIISIHRSKNPHGQKKKTTSFIKLTSSGAISGLKLPNFYQDVQTMPSKITGTRQCEENMKA
jgi:hypothetical protein